MRTEEPYTEENPLTILMDRESLDDPISYEEAYREASIHCMRVMKQALEFITEAASPDLAAWGVSYALNTTATTMSMRKRAESMGYSHNAISQYAAEFKRQINL